MILVEEVMVEIVVVVKENDFDCYWCILLILDEFKEFGLSVF